MKALNHTHLNGLRALESCGRLGSLKDAAAELGVTVGAVSQQVIRAEAQLGRPVFDRTTKGLRPTRFGAEFLQRLTAGFTMLEQAVASAAQHPPNVLTISVAPVFASKWLVPRLGRYAATHPGMQVRLDASIGLVDPAVSDIDIAIRVGPGGWAGVREEQILEQEVFPVCAPDIAARLSTPADLLKIPVVADANSNLRWQIWLDHFGLSEEEMTPGSSFTDASLALDAVIAGQGVMLAWQTLAEYGLRSGTLAAPFPYRARTGLSYWLITARSRPDDDRVRGFKKWLLGEIAETKAMFGPIE
jgi:LysR family transcriptional regulator, glycine cleavage system transcriptional activator